jgi:site-specific recombinase XerD
MNELTYEAVRAIVTEHMKYRNYAETTIRKTFFTLKSFNRYLQSKGVKDYREVAEKDYYDFQEYAERHTKRGLKESTLNGMGMELRRVFSVLEEEEKILLQPFADIEFIKVRRNIRDMVLSETEIREVLESIDIGDQYGFRARAILELIYGTGIRARELCNLELSDFLKEEKMLFIRNGKGRKDRIIPMGPSTIEFLSQYIRQARKKFTRRKGPANYVFPTRSGGKLSPEGLKNIFAKIRENCPVKKHFTPHVIRHSYATHLINAGADIRDVQMLLGHSHIKSTEIYLNLATADLKKVYEKYHPLENELFFDVYGRERYVLDWEREEKKTCRKRRRRLK